MLLWRRGVAHCVCVCVLVLQAGPVWQQIVDFCENNEWSAAIGGHVGPLRSQLAEAQQQLAEAQNTISRQQQQLEEQQQQLEEQAAQLAAPTAQLVLRQQQE